jgi:hypothetical protein
MGTAQATFAVERYGGATGSHVTGSDMTGSGASHVTGSDVSHCLEECSAHAQPEVTPYPP